MNERRWYHLHLVTCIVLIVMVYHWPGYLDDLHFQWPLEDNYHHWATYDDFKSLFDIIGAVGFTVLVFDSIVLLVCLSCTATLLERWLRSPHKWQLRLSTFLASTAVLSCLFAFGTWERSHAATTNGAWVFSELLGENRVFYHWQLHETPYAWTPVIAVYLGLGCTIYMAGWLMLHLLKRAWQFAFRRKARHDQ